MRRITLIAAAMSLIASLAGGGAWAQNSFPNRPIKVVVVTGPGSATDVITRLVSERAQVTLGQPIVVENRPGAGGVAATQFVKQSPADGYTLLVGGAYNLATAVHLVPKLGYDPTVDLAPVTRLFDVGYVLVVSPDLPAKSLPDFLDLVRKNPGKYNYASIGNASTSHLTMEMLKARTSMEITHVPYKTDAAALPDVVSGQVQAMFDPISAVANFVATGRLRALAYSGTKRNPAMPDLPLVSDAVPGFSSVSWLALLAPAGTPSAVVDRLNKAYVAALDAPEIRARIAQLGATAVSSTPEGLGTYMQGEIRKAGEAVRKSNIKLD